MKIIKYLALMFIGYTSLNAQKSKFSFNVSGKIIDEKTNKPLEYVNTALFLVADSTLITGTITGSDGTFDIQTTKPGEYYLVADFIGFEKKTIQNINLKPENNSFDAGEIRIKHSIVGIDEVEVVAEKPFITYHLDKKVVDVSKNPSAQGGTAVDALENVPSIQTDMEGNVSLRGSSNFTVLIDGRQTTLTGTDALNQIPASAINKIEIITNPSVKYDPDGTTGIINIISKKGRLKGHSMVINTSLGNSPVIGGDAIYSYRKEKLTFNGSINYRNSGRTMHRFNDQYISYVNDNTGDVDSVRNLVNKIDGSGAHRNAGIKAGIDYEVVEGNIMNIGFSYRDFLFNRESNSRISNYTGTPYQTNNISSDYFGVNIKGWQVNVGDKHVFNNNQQHYFSFDAMYQTRGGFQSNGIESRLTDQDWVIYGQDTVDRKTRTEVSGYSYRVEIDYMQPLSEKFYFEAGYTLRIESNIQEYSYLTRDIEMLQWNVLADFDDKSYYSRNINAGWALFKGELIGLAFNGGLRLEHTDRNLETVKDNYKFNYNYLGYYPSFSVSKELNKGNTLQVSYSKRINRPRPWHLNPFPRLSDGYSIFQPNPELEPEYASAYEINLQKSLGGISFLSLETFYHYTKNKLERLQMTENDTLYVYTMINQGSDQRFGAELGGHIKVNKWFSFIPGITAYYYRLDGKYLGAPKVVTSSVINSQLTGNFIFPTKTRLQIKGSYRGPEEEIDEREEAMYWMSAAIRQEFLNRKLAVTFRIDDIFSSRKRTGIVYSENSIVYTERYRDSPNFVLSVNLRLNQNNDKKRGRSDDYSNGDNGGEMDMEF
jgi:outer membrane receptor protein involved in Fe transport